MSSIQWPGLHYTLSSAPAFVCVCLSSPHTTERLWNILAAWDCLHSWKLELQLSSGPISCLHVYSLPSVMAVSLWVIYRVCCYSVCVCVCQWCNPIPCSVYYPNLDINSQRASNLGFACMYTFIRLTAVVTSWSFTAQLTAWFSAVIVITMHRNSVVYGIVNEIHWAIFSKFEMLIA